MMVMECLPNGNLREHLLELNERCVCIVCVCACMRVCMCVLLLHKEGAMQLGR